METGDSQPDLPERRGPDQVGADGLRVGDDDRDAAMSALSDHLSAGRLTVDEFGDRTAAASAAVTRADVARLFTDLPAPHPVLPSTLPSPAPGEWVGRGPAPWHGPRPSALPAIAAGIALLAVIPLVMGLAFAGVHVPGLLFLPLFFLVIGGFGRHGRGPRG